MRDRINGFNLCGGGCVTRVDAAHRYRGADDVCLVTTFFNPAGFRSRKAMYDAFAQRADAGNVRLITIECIFNSSDFELPESTGVLRIRARDAMWQKERLINAALARLPRPCTKVVWIDCDVMFENADWVAETSRLLDRHSLVQPFETAYWLPKGATSYDGEGVVFRGFAASHAANPGVVVAGDFQAHGVPGYAWGARRELLERHGLYDACVIGGGDHLMAHAACGDWSSKCFGWSLGLDSPHHRHFVRWAKAFHSDVRGQMTFVPGGLLHMWHGNWEHRNYTARHKALKSFDFDPAVDVRIGDTGAWEWASDKPEMHAWAATYFENRREDDDPAVSIPSASGPLH
ncbi:MAG TPA: hypothetical protein PLF26_09500 [Blastocatellia bacterium]|nr:hypothetical protein [Blastocatellia bacterium]